MNRWIVCREVAQLEVKKDDIESANKRTLRRYIRNTYEARIDEEEEGADSTKAYIVQLFKGINTVNATIADEGEATTNAQDEESNKVRILLLKRMLVMRMNSKILMV